MALDIRKTGTRGLKGLPGINKQLNFRNDDGTFNLRAMAQNSPSFVATSLSPKLDSLYVGLELGAKGFGDSKYDYEATTMADILDINDWRGKTQSGFALIAAGVGKMIGLAASTFLESTVGLLAGVGTAIGEGRWSGLWDNVVNNALDDFNKLFEELMPNYYTNAELEDPWYQHIFSANFLGDKILKNMGFTIGAIGAAALTSGGSLVGAGVERGIGLIGKGLLWAGKTGKTLETVEKVAAASGKFATKAANSFIAATGEASVEAIGAAKEFKQLQLQAIDEKISLLTAMIELERAYNLANGMPKSLADSIYLSKLLKLDEQHKLMIAEVDKNATDAGNSVYAANIGILMASNMILFGKTLLGGYTSRAERLAAIAALKKALMSQGMSEEAATLQATRSVNSGSMLNFMERNGLKALVGGKEVSSALEFGLGTVNGKALFAVDESLKPTMKDRVMGGVKSLFSEGGEEASQNIASGTASIQATAKQAEWEKEQSKNGKLSTSLLVNQESPYAKRELLNFSTALGQTLKENFGSLDSNGWEEFFLGGISGALGVPIIGRKKGKDGKSKIGLTWAGGFKELYDEKLEEYERSLGIANLVNQYLKDPKFVARLRHAAGSTSLNSVMDKALAELDILAFKNAEILSLANDFDFLNMFGGMESYMEAQKSIANGLSDIDVKTIREILGEETVKGKTDDLIRLTYLNKAKSNLKKLESILLAREEVERMKKFDELSAFAASELTTMKALHTNTQERINELYLQIEDIKKENKPGSVYEVKNLERDLEKLYQLKYRLASEIEEAVKDPKSLNVKIEKMLKSAQLQQQAANRDDFIIATQNAQSINDVAQLYNSTDELFKDEALNQSIDKLEKDGKTLLALLLRDFKLFLLDTTAIKNDLTTSIEKAITDKHLKTAVDSDSGRSVIQEMVEDWIDKAVYSIAQLGKEMNRDNLLSQLKRRFANGKDALSNEISIYSNNRSNTVEGYKTLIEDSLKKAIEHLLKLYLRIISSPLSQNQKYKGLEGAIVNSVLNSMFNGTPQLQKNARDGFIHLHADSAGYDYNSLTEEQRNQLAEPFDYIIRYLQNTNQDGSMNENNFRVKLAALDALDNLYDSVSTTRKVADSGKPEGATSPTETPTPTKTAKEGVSSDGASTTGSSGKINKAKKPHFSKKRGRFNRSPLAVFNKYRKKNAEKTIQKTFALLFKKLKEAINSPTMGSTELIALIRKSIVESEFFKKKLSNDLDLAIDVTSGEFCVFNASLAILDGVDPGYKIILWKGNTGIIETSEVTTKSKQESPIESSKLKEIDKKEKDELEEKEDKKEQKSKLSLLLEKLLNLCQSFIDSNVAGSTEVLKQFEILKGISNDNTIENLVKKINALLTILTAILKSSYSKKSEILNYIYSLFKLVNDLGKIHLASFVGQIIDNEYDLTSGDIDITTIKSDDCPVFRGGVVTEIKKLEITKDSQGDIQKGNYVVSVPTLKRKNELLADDKIQEFPKNLIPDHMLDGHSIVGKVNEIVTLPTGTYVDLVIEDINGNRDVYTTTVTEKEEEEEAETDVIIFENPATFDKFFEGFENLVLKQSTNDKSTVPAELFSQALNECIIAEETGNTEQGIKAAVKLIETLNGSVMKESLALLLQSDIIAAFERFGTEDIKKLWNLKHSKKNEPTNILEIHIEPTSTASFWGRQIGLYNNALLESDGILDFHGNFVNHWVNTDFNTLYVIDKYLHKIILKNNTIHYIRYYDENTTDKRNPLKTSILLAVEYNNATLKIIPRYEIGDGKPIKKLITVGGKEYLVVGTLGTPRTGDSAETSRELTKSYLVVESSFEGLEAQLGDDCIISPTTNKVKKIYPGEIVYLDRTEGHTFLQVNDVKDLMQKDGMSLNEFGFGYVGYELGLIPTLKITRTPNTKGIYAPKNLRAGTVYMFIPTANGSHIPLEILPILWNEISKYGFSSTALGSTINNLIEKIVRNEDLRPSLINELFTLYLIAPDPIDVKPTKAGNFLLRVGLKFDSLQLDNSSEEAVLLSILKIYQALQEINPRISINKDFLMTPSDIKEYLDSGILKVNADHLYTRGANFYLYPHNEKQEIITTQQYKSSDFEKYGLKAFSGLYIGTGNGEYRIINNSDGTYTFVNARDNLEIASNQLTDAERSDMIDIVNTSIDSPNLIHIKNPHPKETDKGVYITYIKTTLGNWYMSRDNGGYQKLNSEDDKYKIIISNLEKQLKGENVVDLKEMPEGDVEKGPTEAPFVPIEPLNKKTIPTEASKERKFTSKEELEESKKSSNFVNRLNSSDALADNVEDAMIAADMLSEEELDDKYLSTIIYNKLHKLAEDKGKQNILDVLDGKVAKSDEEIETLIESLINCN